MNVATADHTHVLLVGAAGLERELAQKLLEQAGYRVSSAADGEDALRVFARTPAALVLLDVALPSHGSFVTCRRMRALPSGDRVAIVFMAESDDVELQQHALECGADDFLLKPLRAQSLVRVRALFRIQQLHEHWARSMAAAVAERDALVRLSRQREENTALLVHDMKNPLAGVLSNAEFLVNSRGLDEDQEGCAQDILHASRRLHRMVMNVLDLSRSEHGVLLPSAASLDLTELVETVKTQCAPKLRDKALSLNVLLPAQPIRLDVDRDMLMRLLANLLDSAIRHAPANSSIGLEVSADATSVELRVSDSGPRIPEAERSEVFQSYARMTDASGRVRPRHGLGLSSSRAVAEAHGGEIWVADNASEGATLCVRLPRLP